MANSNGWIRLHKRILRWEWFSDGKTLSVFIYLLLSANFTDGYLQNVPVKRGQVVTSYQRIAASTGISLSSARRAVENLVSTGEISYEATNKYSLITINKYEMYQDVSNFEQVGEQAEERAAEQHHKKKRNTLKENKEKKKENSKENSEQPKEQSEGQAEEQEYIPQYWERNIPKQYYGRFQTEDDWWEYVDQHRDEVEDATYGV